MRLEQTSYNSGYNTGNLTEFGSKVAGSGGLFQRSGTFTDNAGRLTARLVSACGPFEVRQVMADASKDLIQARMMASLMKGKEGAVARACVKRLERLIGRGSRKLKELEKEESLRLSRKRAERKKQERRAEEIKNELRKRKIVRKAIEQGYLRNTGYTPYCGYEPEYYHDTAPDSTIDAQAAILAAAEVAAEGVTSGGGGGEAGVSVEGGGEAAPPAAMDISV